MLKKLEVKISFSSIAPSKPPNRRSNPLGRSFHLRQDYGGQVSEASQLLPLIQLFTLKGQT